MSYDKKHFDTLSEKEARDFAEENNGRVNSNPDNASKAYTVTYNTTNNSNENITQEHDERSIETGDYNTFGYSDEYWD